MRKGRPNNRSRRRPAGHAFRTADAFDEPLAERVDRLEVGSHPFAHDLAVDVHHVSMANVILVHDVAHLHARAELAALGLGAEDRNLRGGKVVENFPRHFGERTVRVFLQNENCVLGTDLLDLLLKSGGDVARRFIGDDGNAFVRLKPQAITDGVARAGSQLGINGEGGGGRNDWAWRRALTMARKTARGNCRSGLRHGGSRERSRP